VGYWRTKPLDQRLQDTYTFIQGLGLPGLDVGTTLMDLRGRALDAAGQLVPLIQAMSLGFRWEIHKSADETRRRHYIRSVIFGYATLGDPDHAGKLLTVAEVTAKKNTIAKLSEIELSPPLQKFANVFWSERGCRV
jgi:hypothetical protein